MKHWQESIARILGEEFSPAAQALLVKRTLQALPRADQALLRRALDGEWELIDADLIERIRPTFVAEAQRMIQARKKEDHH